MGQTLKQVRWRCPSCSSGVLAPSRPRKLDTRRYCLDCSKNSPRLVERVPVALEAKRKERKRSQAKRAAKKRGFKRPLGYYVITTHGSADVRRNLVVVPDSAVRVRATKGPGPIVVRNESHFKATVTFRKGPWADRFDLAAQVYIADARWSIEVVQNTLHPKLAKPLSRAERLHVLQGAIKDRIGPKSVNAMHPLAGWKPHSIAALEISLAEHLRKNAAVKLLQESSEIMERAG